MSLGLTIVVMVFALPIIAANWYFMLLVAEAYVWFVVYSTHMYIHLNNFRVKKAHEPS